MSSSETFALEQGDGAGWRREEKTLLWSECFDGAKYPSGQSAARPCFDLIDSEPGLRHETFYPQAPSVAMTSEIPDTIFRKR
jgi:hypothetical protein